MGNGAKNIFYGYLRNFQRNRTFLGGSLKSDWKTSFNKSPEIKWNDKNVAHNSYQNASEFVISPSIDMEVKSWIIFHNYEILMLITKNDRN